MFVKINEKEYELSTKLGTAMLIEKKFKIPVKDIFEKLSIATTEELIAMVEIAAKQADKTVDIATELINNYDYLDLFILVQELVVKIMFAGTAEQNEAKLSKLKFDEEAKNAIRELLGLPIAEDSTGTA